MADKAVRQRQVPIEDVGQKHRAKHDSGGLGDKKSSSSNPRDPNATLMLKVFIFALFFIPLFLFLTYVFFLPSQYFPVEYRIPEPPTLEGPLEVNTHLQKAEKLFEGKVAGPEAIAHHKGHLYTGTLDGRILHIHRGEIRTVTNFRKKLCTTHSYVTEPSCGRPLGMKFDPDGYLVVVEPYSGLYRVNVATGDVHLLLPSSVEVDGRPMVYLNSVDVASDGTIYMTDSSVFPNRDYILDLLDGRPTGRLLRYDPVKNTTEVLLDNLHFANGVLLSRYEDYVLVCETFASRIMKYNLKGINAGHAEVFVENLPGTPDNIKASASGGVWVALPSVRHQDQFFNALDFLASRTWLRLILSKLEKIVPVATAVPGGTMVIELNSSGKVVRTLMDINGKHLRWIAEVEDVAGVLYLGSFREPYIARLDASRIV